MSFKICTIGCGGMANSGHGPSYVKYSLENSGVELAACCDIDEAKAIAFKSRFGFRRHYTDFELMLNEEKPDAVCLVVSESIAAAISIKILERHIPLLLEKPPGRMPSETLAMINAAESTKTPNQVAFNRRHMPLIRKLKDIVEADGAQGGIRNIQCSFLRYRRISADFATTAIHGIDTVRFLAGADYEHIRFHYQELGQGVENIFMDCTFTSGATAQLCFCPMSGLVAERYTVTAADKTFFLETPVWDGFDAPGRLLGVSGNDILCDIAGGEVASSGELFDTNGFFAENKAFFDDIRAGRRPVDDIRSGLQSVEVADCIRNKRAEYHC